MDLELNDKADVAQQAKVLTSEDSAHRHAKKFASMELPEMQPGELPGVDGINGHQQVRLWAVRGCRGHALCTGRQAMKCLGHNEVMDARQWAAAQVPEAWGEFKGSSFAVLLQGAGGSLPLSVLGTVMKRCLSLQWHARGDSVRIC